MAFQSPTRGISAAINMTPMIDVLLVLLIIFMLVAPTHPAGLPAAIPQPAPETARAPAPENPIVLEIDRDGAIRINTRTIALPRLAGEIARIFAARSERILFLRANGNLEFAQVAAVIDTARGAGVERTALLTAR